MRFVLASASPARLRVLQDAGLCPEVLVSGVDEDQFGDLAAVALVQALAKAKAEQVAASLPDADLVLIGCDSLFEFAGEVFGKPGSAQRARQRCRALSGKSGLLHTGHHVIVRTNGMQSCRTAVATTGVNFGEFSQAEIEAYVATGEPLNVAGGFTIDGYGGAFIAGLQGDHTNVIGLSLPLFRQLLADLGVSYHQLWKKSESPDNESG